MANPMPTLTLPESMTETVVLHRYIAGRLEDLVPPSPEQSVFLNHQFIRIERGDPIHSVVEAVAGSGKTTTLRVFFRGLATAHVEDGIHFSITATAFNGSIAGVVNEAMMAEKPDGADWTSGGGTGTLNSHGKKTLARGLPHPLQLDNGRYTNLARIIASNSLADTAIRADWLANNLMSEHGNRREMASWFAYAKFIRDVTVGAMKSGLYVDALSSFQVSKMPTDEEWADYMNMVRGGLRISEKPVGNIILERLPELCRELVDLAVLTITNPEYAARVNDDAMVWVGDGRGALLAANDPQVNDDVLRGRGCLVEPLGTETKDGITAIPYRSTGQYAHNRYEIILPTTDFDLMKQVKDALWNGRNDMGRGGYANDGPRTQPNWDRRSAAKYQTDEWVLSIKDSREAIDAFITIVDRATNGRWNAADAFNGEEQGEQVTKARYAHLDEIFMPLRLNLPIWRTYDLVVCDEVQDMSALQHRLLGMLVKDGGSVVFVGDRRQSLYGFNFALATSMDLAQEVYGCESYPMTVCWRQSDALAQDVRTILGTLDGEATIYADHKSPIGLIPDWRVGNHTVVAHRDDLARNVEHGDMVLCRLAAPLAGEFRKVIRMGKLAQIAGGGDLQSWFERLWDGNHCNMVHNGEERSPISAFDSNMADYLQRLYDRLLRKHAGDEDAVEDDSDWTDANDYCEALSAIVGLYHTTTSEPSSKGFLDYLESIFVDPHGDGENYVMFSTVHRAKGLERDTVHIIGDRVGKEDEPQPCFMFPFSMHTEDDVWQERNNIYVAFTRAKNNQFYYTVDPRRGAPTTSLRDAMFMLDTGDIRDLDDSPRTEDDDDDDQTQVSKEQAMIDVTNSIYSIGQTPVVEDAVEPVEASVAPTPTEDEEVATAAITDPIYAAFLNGEVKDVWYDTQTAIQWLTAFAPQDFDINTYKGGEEVNGRAVWLINTDEPVPTEIKEQVDEWVAYHWNKQVGSTGITEAQQAEIMDDIAKSFGDDGATRVVDEEGRVGYQFTVKTPLPVVEDESPKSVRRTPTQRFAMMLAQTAATGGRGIVSTERMLTLANTSKKTMRTTLETVAQSESNLDGLEVNWGEDDADHWTSLTYTPPQGEGAYNGTLIVRAYRHPSGNIAWSKNRGFTFKWVPNYTAEERNQMLENAAQTVGHRLQENAQAIQDTIDEIRAEINEE